MLYDNFFIYVTLSFFYQDYYDIIKTPMDLATIKNKLDTGQYTDPWLYCDDVWLMFDNAWLYNKKTSRVYKWCSKVRSAFSSKRDHYFTDYFIPIIFRK